MAKSSNYVMDPRKRGHAGKLFIFNMENFQNSGPHSLDSGSKDVETLQKTFLMFNADVRRVFKNKTTEKIRYAMNKISNKDYSNFQYFVIAILTHGNRHNSMAANDGSFNLDTDIILPVLKNKSLLNVPKLFIIDACKGDIHNAGRSSRSTYITRGCAQGSEAMPGSTLRCYATTECFTALCKKSGSIFTTEFCENLRAYGKDYTVEQVMKMTIKSVATKTKRVQVPSYESNMIRSFCLGKYI